MSKNAAIGLSILVALLCLATPVPADEAPDAYVEYTRARIQKAEAARAEKVRERKTRLEQLEEARQAFTQPNRDGSSERPDPEAWNAAILAVYDADGDGKISHVELELFQRDRMEELRSKQPPEGESRRKRRLAEENKAKAAADEDRKPTENAETTEEEK